MAGCRHFEKCLEAAGREEIVAQVSFDSISIYASFFLPIEIACAH
jgi:hypothetical protein